MANPQSTAKIAGHPIHPMLIPFPIAFFVSAFVCDIAFGVTANAMWSTAALWLIGAGVVMALLAALAGLTDVVGDRRIRDLTDVWWHAGGNVLVVLIQIYNWYSRLRECRNSASRLDPLPDRGRYFALHRLEGMGNGLSSPRRCC
jgi:uncharacterized membrane protein